MKKLIIIGVIVFALAGIFVHDAVVEKQNRERIETIRGWTVISREGTWVDGIPLPAASGWEVTWINPPELESRLSAIEQRLEKIEKMLRKKP